MERYEREALRSFDSVIAVSERDARQFRERYGIAAPATIPTGVDLDFFAWSEPPAVSDATPPTVVFTGSMDWEANVDGVRFFLAEVWPLIQATKLGWDLNRSRTFSPLPSAAKLHDGWWEAAITSWFDDSLEKTTRFELVVEGK